MAIKIFAGANWRTISAAKVYFNGAWRTLQKIQIYRGGAWRVVANFVSPLTLSASPTELSAKTTTYGGTAQTVVDVVATPSGGVGPFTYSWSVLSYQNALPTVVSPTSASTRFQQANVTNEIASDNAFRCTVTDSLGATATADVLIHFFYFDNSGGGFA